MRLMQLPPVGAPPFGAMVGKLTGVRQPLQSFSSQPGSGMVAAMADILPFQKPAAKSRGKGSTLCKRGFHKWQLVNRPFDVKQGKLVSCYRCQRCGKEKTSAD